MRFVSICWLGFCFSAIANGSATDSISACRTLRHTDAKATVVQCNLAYLENQNNALIAFEMLSHRSDAEVMLGDFPAARTSLDLMAKIPLPTSQWEMQFRLLKRRGNLAYRSNELSKAHDYLHAALALAETHEHQAFLGFIFSDLAILARRSGDYRTSLSYLKKALTHLRQVDHADVAPTLNNLGDLHKDLGEFDDARNRYSEALTLYQEQDRTQKAAHVTESLGLVAEAVGDLAGARKTLEDSYQQFTKLGLQAEALRVLGDLLRLALDQGDIAAATALLQRWQSSASFVAPLRLQIQHARYLRLTGNAQDAMKALEQLQTQMHSTDRYLPTLQIELAESATALGRLDQAAGYWRDAISRERDLLRRNYQQETSNLRVGLEVQQNERVKAEAAVRQTQSAMLQAKAEADALHARNRLRWISLLGMLILTSLLGLALWQRARRLQQRMDDAKQLAAAQQQYRAAADALQKQDERQNAVLELIAPASAIVSVEGLFEQVNLAFAKALDCPSYELIGQAIFQKLTALSPQTWQRLTGQLDEADLGLHVTPPKIISDGREFTVRGLGGSQLGFLVRIEPHAGVTRTDHQIEADRVPPALDAVDVGESADLSSDPPETSLGWENKEQRQRLVAMMLNTVQAFERSTGKTRIELAERSKLWRVTVDDGRLRVRAMERYLSVQKLPKIPRWREVLRTTYFVLAECTLDASQRTQLEQQLEEIQIYLRQLALLPESDTGALIKLA